MVYLRLVCLVSFALFFFLCDRISLFFGWILYPFYSLVFIVEKIRRRGSQRHRISRVVPLYIINMDLRGFFSRNHGIQQQIAAFCLSAGIVLAMEAILFYFAHAPHSRKRLSELVTEANAIAVTDKEKHSVAANVSPLTRTTLRVLCARNAAHVHTENKHTMRTASLIAFIPIAIGVGWILYQPPRHAGGHGAAVAVEAVVVALSTAVILAIFHGAAKEWHHASLADTVDDIAHGYFHAVEDTKGKTAPVLQS